MARDERRSPGEELDIDRAVNAPRIAIEHIEPQVCGGRFAAKALVERPITVTAVIFADGHDKLSAQLKWRPVDGAHWHSAPLLHLGNDHWQGKFVCEEPARVEFVVEAWMDTYLSFCDELGKKFSAGIDVEVEIMEGEALLRQVARDETDANTEILQQFAAAVARDSPSKNKVELLLSKEVVDAMRRAESRPHYIRSNSLYLEVERRAAEFASWYELFPRSAGADATRHGTFADVVKSLPRIREMGFDVLYFPPIHPIGVTHRKGPNNALCAGEGNPGSPYAIGGDEGGHDAIHPQLGTLKDFLALVTEARRQGLEVALDFAIQCSPDHPWVKDQPDWFRWRPDGTIRYAENPPKKYEDIVNVDFYAAGSIPDLWLALRDLVLLWVERGVKMFRVDNPHTKPLPFWEWLIEDVRRRHPEVIFLAEAFTRPAMMARLGKLGFSQSYSYFTWRNTKDELQHYLSELNQRPWRDCYRPNFFVNTPDINPYFLQKSGRAGFLIRAALAAMGSGLWGMYSGFEICEAAALPGKEEYLDSEKYQLKARNYAFDGNICAEIASLNRIRRANPALQTHLGLQIYNVWNDNILLFGKRTEDLSNFILVAVSLDPRHAQEAYFELPLWEFGLPDDAAMGGEDLMNGHSWTWFGKIQWMRIEPWRLPFGIWRLTRPKREV